MNQKRERARNFSEEEKILCLNILNRFKHIIENKKTDSVSWKNKEEAWQKITDEFNAQCPGLVKRTKENLKNFFENRKRETRKLAAKERSCLYQTGGGPSTSNITDPLFDLTMSIMNSKSVTGIVGVLDGDTIEKDEAGFETIHVHVVDNDERENVNVENEDEENQRTNDVAVDMPCKKTWTSRRRPPAPSQDYNLAEKYQELANLKIEVANIQVQMLKQDALHQQKKQKLELEELQERKQSFEYERQLKLQQMKEEHDLRLESLQCEIQLKKAQMRALERH